MTNKKANPKWLAQVALLVALEIIMGVTPLGSIPIGPIVATLAHIPVIIAAVVLGPATGALIGFAFGAVSFFYFTVLAPSPISFVFSPFYSFGGVHGNFWSLVICFVPRILIGVVAGFLFHRVFKKYQDKAWTYLVCGIAGTAVNTFLVLGGIYVFFGPAYAEAVGASFPVLATLMLGTITSNGVLEAVLAAVLTFAICRPLIKFNQKTLS